MCQCTPGIKTPWCGKPGCERPTQTDAKTPVVVVGSDRETSALLVVGLYETAQKATEAIQGGSLPTAFYSIVTPPMNGCLQGRPRTVTMTDFGN